MRSVVIGLVAVAVLLSGCSDSGNGDRAGTDNPAQRSDSSGSVKPAEFEDLRAAFFDLRQFRTTMLIDGGPKKTFVEFKVSLEIDYERRQSISSQLEAVRHLIHELSISEVVEPLRYEDLGKSSTIKQIREQIHQVVNGVLKNRTDLPDGMVRDVFVTDFRF